jgi:hypothetical protein
MRKVARLLIVGALGAWAAGALAGAEPGGKAKYVGGTVPEIPQGVDGVLQTIHREYFQFLTRKGTLEIPYADINLLEYGQKAGRRYIMAVLISPVLLLSKGRNHYLTIGYSDGEGKQQALVFQVDKSDIRSVLVSLEARTGRKVDYQDDEARKAGKG